MRLMPPPCRCSPLRLRGVTYFAGRFRYDGCRAASLMPLLPMPFAVIYADATPLARLCRFCAAALFHDIFFRASYAVCFDERRAMQMRCRPSYAMPAAIFMPLDCHCY